MLFRKRETDYVIIQGETTGELRDRVITYLEAGWRCAGGVAVSHFEWSHDGRDSNTERVWGFLQAMKR